MERIDNSNIIAGYYNYWSIWYYRNKQVSHLCGQQYCEEWVANWTVNYISAHKLTNQDGIQCLYNGCATKLTYEDLAKTMSSPTLNKINEAYNANYFTYTEDISRCPKSGCDYAGFFKRGACRANMICEKCNFEWKDFSQLTAFEKISKSAKEAFKLNSETNNYLNEVVWSNACPGWGIWIYKLDGCSHMVWQKCKYEFWWICLDHYPGYRHQGTTICGVRKLVTIVMLMMCMFIATSHLLYTDLWIAWIFRWIIRFIIWKLGKFILSNIAGLSILLTFPLSFGFVSWMNSYSYSMCDSFSKIFTGFLVIFYPMGWGFMMYFSYQSSTFSFVPMYIIYEICFVIVLVVGGIALFLFGLLCYFCIGPLFKISFLLMVSISNKASGLLCRRLKNN